MTTITLDEWVRQFEGIKQSSYPLWTAIRWEFETQQPPMTVRQMFYQMAVKYVVEKSMGGYRRVQYALTQMRRKDAIPYEWITDSSRYMLKQPSYRTMADALSQWQKNYRRALWDEQAVCVHIWLEKMALAGVIQDITERYDVPLYPARGYSSISFAHEIAAGMIGIDKPIYVYHFGDYDPSGVDAARAIADELRGHGVDFYFETVAVTSEQIKRLNLPSRLTKRSDPRSKKWIAAGKGDSVELDALPASQLRTLVEQVIEQHINPQQLATTRIIEQEERARIQDMIDGFGTSTRNELVE